MPDQTAQIDVKQESAQRKHPHKHTHTHTHTPRCL